MNGKRSGQPVEATRESDKYLVPIVAKAIDLLDCFGDKGESLNLKEIIERTGLPHTTAYRILHTLVSRDYITQAGRLYRVNRLRKKLKIGFANLSDEISVAVEIQRSLEKATAAAGIELLVWNNERNADKAIRNAEEMAMSKVDVGIEFQLFEQVAPVIADLFSHARIPLISIVNPHHGTLYVGVNNYSAGFSAGVALAEFAAKRWRTLPDALLLLESPPAGRTVQSRLVGVWRGVESKVGPLPPDSVKHLDSGGDKATSKSVVQGFLRKHPAERVLIAGINDESAIGAVEAIEQKARRRHVAVVGHGGSAEILEMVADPDSCCIGTVSFHSELYGPDLISFAQAILRGRSNTPAHYIAHEFIGKASLKPRR